MGKKSKAIPDRWEAYSKFGGVVKGTLFFPFKVPLKEALTRRLLEDERFTPASFMKHLKENEKPLGLLIDLTNTQRYYCPMEFKNHDVGYAKIFCPGHGEIPSLKVVKRFYKAVDNFLNNDSEKEGLIGVHCTHGINRTGYLICRYMIEKMNFSPAEALKAFAEARGYPIERREYIEDLYNLQPLSSQDGSIEDEDDDDDDDDNSNGNDVHRCNSCTEQSDTRYNTFDYQTISYRNRRHQNYSNEICEGDSYYNRTRQYGDNRKLIRYNDMDSQTRNSNRRYHPNEEWSRRAYGKEGGCFTPPGFVSANARSFRQFHPYNNSSRRDVFQRRGGWQNEHYQLKRRVIDSHDFRGNHTWNDARQYLNGYSRLNRRAYHDSQRYQS